MFAPGAGAGVALGLALAGLLALGGRCAQVGGGRGGYTVTSSFMHVCGAVAGDAAGVK